MSAPTIINPPASGGGAPVGGSGTAGKLAKWATTTTLNDSVITQSGSFVGINVASPTRELDVTGSVNISQQLYVGNGTQGFFTWGGGAGNTFNLVGSTGKAISLGSNGVYDRLFVATNGKVGIGVTAPAAILDVAGGSADTDFRVSRVAVPAAYFAISAPGGSPAISQFFINGMGVMALQDTGKVGIGTASPTAPLHVVGDVTGFPTSGAFGQLEITGKTTPAYRLSIGMNITNARGFIQAIHEATAYKDLLLNPNGGNVGIGIGSTSPTAALDLAASTTARASLRIQTGTAPTTPNNGDIWFDGTNIKMQIGGVTKTFTLV